MTIPTVAGVGATNHGTTAAVTYALPAHQADDILLLFVETNVTGGVTAPTQDGGWAHVTNSPRAQGANVTSLSVMWKRATSSAMTDPQITAAADHQDGFTVVIRGAITTGNPWDFAPVGAGAAVGGPTFTATGGTTTVVDTLVVVGIAGNLDQTTDQFTSGVNASLSGFAQQAQISTTDGNGGAVVVYTGGKAAIGATGSTTGSTTSAYSALTLAIKPAVVVAADMAPAARRVNRPSGRRMPVPEFRGIFVAEIPWQQSRPIRVQRHGPLRRPQRYATSNFVAPPPPQQQTPPAFVPGRQRERVRLAAAARTRLEFVPVPLTVVPPPAFVPGVQGRDRILRGWLPRRTRRVAGFNQEGPPRPTARRVPRILSSRRVRRVEVVPTQVAAPVNPDLIHRATQRRTLRGWLARRADRVEVVPAQVVATAPTLVGRATMRRALRGWPIRRADRVEVVPAPVTPLIPAYVPTATGRRTLRGWIARKARRVEVVPPQTAPAAPAFVPAASRRRPVRHLTRRPRAIPGHMPAPGAPMPARPAARRTRAHTARRTRVLQIVPAQVAVAAPKLVHNPSQRRALRGWIRRAGRIVFPVQPGALNQPARGDLDPHGLGDPFAHPGQPLRTHPSMPPTMRRGSKLTTHKSGGVDLR